MNPAETHNAFYRLIQEMPDIPAIDTTLIEGRELLIDPSKNISMDINEYQVRVESGAKVLVIHQGSNLSVCNLYDARTGAVQVAARDKVLNVLPGQQIVLTKHAGADFDRTNPHFGIGYRNLEKHNLGNGITAFKSEISIISALQVSPPLRFMLKSKEPAHQATIHQVIKNAVIISTLNDCRTPFKNSYQVLVERDEWPVLPVRMAHTKAKQPLISKLVD